MFVYINGKVIEVMDNQIIVRLPNGLGYSIILNPLHKIQVNENVTFYVITAQTPQGHAYYGFADFDQWQLAQTILERGVPPKIVADALWHIGVAKLHQSILQKDDSYLKKVEGLTPKFINKILEIEDEHIPVSRSLPVIEEQKSQSGRVTKADYTAAEFTQRLAALGYSRTRIVQTISYLKKEDLWGKMALVDLVKKSMEILEHKM